MAEVAEAADTQDVSKVGVAISTAPDTVVDESQNPGGYTKNNTPVGPVVGDRAKINPGLRGQR